MDKTTEVLPGAYIAGAWRAGSAGVYEQISPVTEELVQRIDLVDASSVDDAVVAAREAFSSFSQTTVEERAQLLDRLAEELSVARDELVASVVGELGAPIRIAESVHVDGPIRIIQTIAAQIREFEFERSVGNSVIHRVPVGVIAAITPWNYPLHQIVAKVIAAFATGCTVVLKPAEAGSGTARLFVEATQRAGVPAGVLNLLCGRGSDIGPALIDHPGVDMVSFTGSVAVGRRIGAAAGERIKRCTLELGGKSASLVLPDVQGEQLIKAVKVSLANCLLNSGQTCSAWTRLIVPESALEQTLEVLTDAVAKYQEPARLGPMVSAEHRERVLEFMRRAEADGARVIAGGSTSAPSAQRGWFVAPTIYAGVDPKSEIAQEEVFGPVLAVLTYPDDDVDAGVDVANDSQYGLSGAVWGAHDAEAARVAARVRTGQVDVNGARFNPEAPFGGFKNSGIGRELGAAGIEDYLDYQAVQLPQ